MARTLDDMYGSRWITAACGSVVYLEGQAGDLVVKLHHLKQPGAEVGPLELVHDHDQGTTDVREDAEGDPLAAVQASIDPVTVRQVAASIFATTDPSANQIEKARRRLERLAGKGLVEAIRGDNQTPTTYGRPSCA